MTVDPRPAHGPMSLGDIVAELEAVARDGEGADKFRALKMLAGMKGAAAQLPAPLTDDELVDRLARLMRAAGRTLWRRASTKAFPSTGKEPLQPIATADIRSAPADLVAQAKKITTIPRLYRAFPQLKRPGVPRGYPMHSALTTRQTWLFNTALKILMDQQYEDDLKATAEQRRQLQDPPEDSDPDVAEISVPEA